MKGFYDCEKSLLKMKDANGEDPAVYFVCSRVRGPGKTYSIGKHLIKDYFKTGKPFALLARYSKELGSLAEGVFAEMLRDNYPNYFISEKQAMKGTFSEIFLSHKEGEGEIKERCGFVLPLNAADSLKKISSMFAEVSTLYMDEFQPETGSYLPDEIKKFLSVVGSVSRGGGSSVRYVPVIMSSNTISILNPYFEQTGLSTALQENTKKFKGDGFVYQKVENAELVEKHRAQGIARAFKNASSIDYSDDTWMVDNYSGIEKPTKEWGTAPYIATLMSDGKSYGVYFYRASRYLYISHKVDSTYPCVYSVKVDGSPNVAIKTTNLYNNIRDGITRGTIRFDSLETKRLALEIATTRGSV